MAGFSLGGGSRGGGGGEEGGIPPETFFHLYGSGGSANTGGNTGTSRNEEITSYTRGFELWQQHQQQIQRHQHQQLYPSSGGLLTFSDEALHLAGGSGSRGGGSEAIGIRMRGPGSSGGGMSCQDCGNQAKKDCIHMRCRTCCKSRGFQCPTHVKSTWVPASKRRERQQQLAAAASLQQQQQSQQPPLRIGGPSGAGSEPSKRPREITSRLPTTITTTSSGGGGMDALSFPPEVSSPAVFRCVRVSPVDDAEDEYAYQTADVPDIEPIGIMDSSTIEKLSEENIQLFMRREELHQSVARLKQTTEELERQLEEAKKNYSQLALELETRRKKKNVR